MGLGDEGPLHNYNCLFVLYDGGRSGEGPLQSYDGFFFISNYIAGNWLFYMNGDWGMKARFTTITAFLFYTMGTGGIYRLRFDGKKYILTYVTD